MKYARESELTETGRSTYNIFVVYLIVHLTGGLMICAVFFLLDTVFHLKYVDIRGILLGVLICAVNLLSWRLLTKLILSQQGSDDDSGNKGSGGWFILLALLKMPLLALMVALIYLTVPGLVISFLMGYVSLLFVGSVAYCVVASRT